MKPLLGPFVAALVLTNVATAAPPEPPPSPESHEESRKFFRAGNQAWIEGDKVGAQAHYKRALELEESWDVACNLGRAEGELGLDAEALTHLDLCLKEYPPSTEEKVQKARAKFYDLRVEIRDRCKKMGCAYRDPAPSSGLNEPVVAVAGTTAAEPQAANAEPNKVPDQFAPPPEGRPRGASAKWPVVISTAAVGAVGVGLGVGFHFGSQSAGDSAESLASDLIDDGMRCETGSAPECSEYLSKRQEYYDFRTASTVGFVAGGALLVGAVVMAVVWPTSQNTNTRVLRPSLAAGPGHYFVGIQGKF